MKNAEFYPILFFSDLFIFIHSFLIGRFFLNFNKKFQKNMKKLKRSFMINQKSDKRMTMVVYLILEYLVQNFIFNLNYTLANE